MDVRLPEPGDLFDARYRIEQAIGHGGFSRVYRASDEKLGRQVALKVLLAPPGSDDLLARFWRETDLIRKLVHPHTVRVYDFGIAGEALPFIAFELLSGESLGARLSRTGPLSVESARRIAASVLKSLMEAHALGIVHRDIKPANVFLCSFAGEVDFVKLLDFGIAKAPSKQKDLTAHGWLVGTPMYMAPEQILGRELGPRADLYSLGLLLVTMLTNRPPVSGTSHEVIAAQLADEPVVVPPEVLATPLGAVVRRATEKDPARRYASAADMLGDLEGNTPVEPTLFDERALPRSAPPVVYALAPSTPPPAPTPTPAPPRPAPARLGWALAIGAAFFSLCLLLFAGAGIAMFAERSPRELASGIAASDPTLAPALVSVRAERAGMTLGKELPVSEHVVDRAFSSPAAAGVIRFEDHPTLAEAEAAESAARADVQRASTRRGKRLISVWAAPRGRPGFDRALAGRLLRALVPDA